MRLTGGGQILDRNGHPVRLNSINISSMGPGVGLPGPRGQAATGCWGWKAPDEQTFRNVRAWGFNAVRLSVSWANLEPQAPTRGPGGAVQHHYNAQYLSALDAAVKGFTGRGVAVILVIMQSQWSPAFHQNHTAFGVSCQGVGMPTWLYPHASSGQWDVLVVDCAPTAETIRFLSLPDILSWYMERLFPVGRRVSRTVGPIHLRLGWGVEPAFTGSANFVELVLTGPDGAPIADPGGTLTVQVSFGDARRVSGVSLP